MYVTKTEYALSSSTCNISDSLLKFKIFSLLSLLPSPLNL